ncbi:hypothetical protein JW964_14225 [candidate division KSB1 bacterium]|nr:hypothetical protein [candidate division KSB1 bacterium]
MTNQKASKKSFQKSVILIIIFMIIIGGYYYYSTGDNPVNLLKNPKKIDFVVKDIQTKISSLFKKAPEKIETDGEWWHVYFTDPNNINNPENITGSIEEKLIQNIDEAQQSIHIASFEFNLTTVANALINANKRGVEVEWVTDDVQLS